MRYKINYQYVPSIYPICTKYTIYVYQYVPSIPICTKYTIYVCQYVPSILYTYASMYQVYYIRMPSMYQVYYIRMPVCTKYTIYVCPVCTKYTIYVYQYVPSILYPYTSMYQVYYIHMPSMYQVYYINWGSFSSIALHSFSPIVMLLNDCVMLITILPYVHQIIFVGFMYITMQIYIYSRIVFLAIQG